MAPGASWRAWPVAGCLAGTQSVALTAFFFLLAASAGCQRYQSRPIDSAAVARALMLPDADALRVRAATLEHAILEPIQLDIQDGLSPDEAAVLAVLLNPSLRTARDERMLGDAQLLQAGLLPDPELAFDFETPTGGDTSGTVNAFGLGLTWNAASLIHRSAEVRKGRAHCSAIAMDVAWQEWQAAQSAKAAVLRLVSVNEQVVLQEQIRRHLDENVTAIRNAVAGGTQTAKGLSAAQAAARKASTTLLDLQREAAHQELQLNRSLGLPSDRKVRLNPTIELPSSFAPPAARELLAGLEQRRLDLIALRRGYDSQEAAVRAAILRQFPRLSVGPTVGRDIENVDTAGFAVAINLPIFDRNQGNIAAERATRQKLFDEYVNRLFEIRSDVEMLLSRIRFLNEQISAARRAQPELQKLAEDCRTALAAGRVDILTYYAAWSEVMDNRMNLIVLQGRLAEAIVGLESATGIYRIAPPGDGQILAPADPRQMQR
jgi:cobalt-zinc-cadmium efflux system outer membrane protein